MTVRQLPSTPPDMRPTGITAQRRYAPPNVPMHRWMRSGELTAGGVLTTDVSSQSRMTAGGYDFR